ncbi:MAG: Rieske (2Fe-2S) protein [Armatimonadetes bacterium]|nr:Rieske (2Fe-2S) protein [Armatimonadota bacterium]
MSLQIPDDRTPDGKPESEQPQWRRDFPIDWPEDNYISRRDFTRFLVLTSFAFAVGQTWILAMGSMGRGEDRQGRELVASVDDIPEGGAKTFTIKGTKEPFLLVRMSENTFVAYGQKCTHLSCPLIPQPEMGRLYCPCHEGAFDLQTGHPMMGPPRRPLPRVRLEISGNKVYATGVEDHRL